jgi:anti-anti-sigma regulatory factor
MTDEAAQNFELPAIVDLDALEDVREQLLEALNHGPVQMDGSKVERIVTNALIMLLSGAETARRCEFPLTLNAASDAMTSAIARLGMQEQFAPMMEG